ncbi:MAG TPA: carotenoid 1,2-hydratase [Burkholderiaceae bacterium]|nr:carotenoid 1,2-hydratase [Burkholderiaceae bacterium]
MRLRRRVYLLGLPGLWPRAWAAAGTDPAPRPLQFPADFGAHPQVRVEWWYATGWLAPAGSDPMQPTHGFQVTFFRTRTAVPQDHPSAFAARQLVFAHAAVTDLAAPPAAPLRYDQRIARQGFDLAQAAEGDTAVALRGWQLQRRGPVDRSTYHAQVASGPAGFTLALELAASQPLLPHGDEQGVWPNGPRPGLASRYYSHPQLQVSGTVDPAGRGPRLQGRAWLDHEWKEALMDADSVGWDWIGMNLHDGAALMAIRLRRADGTASWAAGSYRAGPQAPVRHFAPGELTFTAQRHWTSPATRTRYPVRWQVDTPVGRFVVNALRDAQELDSRRSTGTLYWEGLAELLDTQDRRVGLGYLELTGYAQPLRL